MTVPLSQADDKRIPASKVRNTQVFRAKKKHIRHLDENTSCVHTGTKRGFRASKEAVLKLRCI